MENEYTEGISGDGAAILKNGQPMTISEILKELNNRSIIQEHGECFTGGHAMEILMNPGSPLALKKWLNARAAEYAAGKVAGMYCEYELRTAILLAIASNANMRSGLSTDEIENEIINQIKNENVQKK